MESRISVITELTVIGKRISTTVRYHRELSVLSPMELGTSQIVWCQLGIQASQVNMLFQSETPVLHELEKEVKLLLKNIGQGFFRIFLENSYNLTIPSLSQLYRVMGHFEQYIPLSDVEPEWRSHANIDDLKSDIGL